VKPSAVFVTARGAETPAWVAGSRNVIDSGGAAAPPHDFGAPPMPPGRVFLVLVA
jgi:hypothetical protein